MVTKFNFETFNPRKPPKEFVSWVKKNSKIIAGALIEQHQYSKRIPFDPPYNPAQIASRLEEAFMTDRRMPRVKYPRVVCYWPDILRDYWENYMRDEPKVNLGRPSNAQITRMDEALEWLKKPYVDVYQSRLLWLRSADWKWKKLSYVFKKSERQLQRDYEEAILTIYQKLGVLNANGEYRKGGIRAVRRF